MIWIIKEGMAIVGVEVWMNMTVVRLESKEGVDEVVNISSW